MVLIKKERAIGGYVVTSIGNNLISRLRANNNLAISRYEDECWIAEPSAVVFLRQYAAEHGHVFDDVK